MTTHDGPWDFVYKGYEVMELAEQVEPSTGNNLNHHHGQGNVTCIYAFTY